ncbi:MAG: Mov34/MPN/PAD-1 family protein [Saprospiraceae bacterium]|nr:Mov34/MPN/PAD-1 family protein [Saprospiraceae bacterium]
MKIKILTSVFNEIVATVGAKKAETGAILLGDRKDYVVQKMIFDPFGSTSAAAYDPDTEFINKVIKHEWDKNNYALLGFVHSHPRGYNRLSGDYGNNTGDVGYLKAIFKAIPSLDKFLVPIVFSTYDGGDLN